MGFFSNILQKLGIRDGADKPADAASGAAPAPSPSAPAGSAPAGAPAPGAAPVAPAAMPMVDVVGQLEKRAAAHSERLNWRTSIVDLLKLLDIDSSLAARKDLAAELGCPADLMGDSARMNMWLHKTVLARISANGGNVPAELLD